MQNLRVTAYNGYIIPMFFNTSAHFKEEAEDAGINKPDPGEIKDDRWVVPFFQEAPQSNGMFWDEEEIELFHHHFNNKKTPVVSNIEIAVHILNYNDYLLY